MFWDDGSDAWEDTQPISQPVERKLDFIDLTQDSEDEDMLELPNIPDPIVLSDVEEEEKEPVNPIEDYYAAYASKVADMKDGKKSKNYVFTINHPGQHHMEILSALEHREDTQYIVYQGEIGDSGTPHIQGFIQFTNRKYFKFLASRIPDAHIEIAKYPNKASVYPEKDKTYAPQICERCKAGTFLAAKGQGHRSDLSNMADDIASGQFQLIEIQKKYPKQSIMYYNGMKNTYMDLTEDQLTRDHCNSFVLFGMSGSGKSYAAKQYLGQVQQAKVAAGGRQERIVSISNNLSNYGQYNSPRLVLVDEFVGGIELNQLKTVLDPQETAAVLHQRYRDARMLAEEIIFTCQNSPATWYTKWATNPEDQFAIFRRIKGFYFFRGRYDPDGEEQVQVYKLEKPKKNLPEWWKHPEWFQEGGDYFEGTVDHEPLTVEEAIAEMSK